MARRLPPTDLERSVHEFLFNRDVEAVATSVKNSARDVLKGWLTLKNAAGKMLNGREDSEGHRYLDFEEPLTINGVTYTGLKAERKTPAAHIDLDKAEALAREKGVYDKVFRRVVTRQFDEDALFLLNQKGVLTDDDLDDLVVTGDPSYALTVVKE